MKDLARIIGLLVDRITHLESRHERMFRFGTVTHVDGDKHRIRVRIGGTDDEPHLSAWHPHAQIAGDDTTGGRKQHSMPSVGQQMVHIAPDGDLEQAFSIPLTWSDKNQSPSKDPNEHVDKAAGTTVTQKNKTYTIEADTILLKSGGTTLTLTSGGLKAVSPDYEFN